MFQSPEAKSIQGTANESVTGNESSACQSAASLIDYRWSSYENPLREYTPTLLTSSEARLTLNQTLVLSNLGIEVNINRDIIIDGFSTVFAWS